MTLIPGHWTCQECQTANKITDTVCDLCGEPYDSESDSPLDDLADDRGDYIRKGRE